MRLGFRLGHVARVQAAHALHLRPQTAARVQARCRRALHDRVPDRQRRAAGRAVRRARPVAREIRRAVVRRRAGGGRRPQAGGGRRRHRVLGAGVRVAVREGSGVRVVVGGKRRMARVEDAAEALQRGRPTHAARRCRQARPPRRTLL